MELLCTDNFIYMDKGFGTRGYTADLFSVQFGASSATCQMQFYYYMTSSSRNSRTCRYCVLPDSQMWKTPGPVLIILVPDDVSFKWEMWLTWDGRGGDSSVVRAPDSWLKGRGFESLLERWENFLLQGRLSVLTLISVSVPPPCYHSCT